MSIAVLPVDPGAQVRTLLHHLLQAGDVIGRDSAGRTVIQLAADDWTLEQLLTFDAGIEDLEDGGSAEPEEGPPVLSVDRLPARRIRRRYASALIAAPSARR